MNKHLLRFLILSCVFALVSSVSHAQTFTQGRLTVDVQNYITRDSTDCSGKLHYKFATSVANSIVTDTVRFQNPGSFIVWDKHINDSAVSPFIFNALTATSMPRNDYDFHGDTAYFFSSDILVTCGSDSIYVFGQYYTIPWPNPCFYDTVTGRMFVDLDSDCLGPYVNAPAVNMIPLTADTCYNGTIKQPVVNMYGNGFYHLTLQKSFRTGCTIYVPPILQFLYPNSNCITQSYSFYDMPNDTVHYPFHPSPMVNVVANAAVTNAVRPQMPFILHPIVYNMGYNPVGGQLYLILDPHVVYNASLSSNLPATVNGDTLMWNFSNLNAISNNGWWNSFLSSIYLTPDNTLAAGDSICFTVFTSPVLNDVDTFDNRKTFCITLVSSYDPNVKQVTPAGEGPTGLIPGSTPQLTYTVHFQNTGTASAINIYVLDTLDANVDSSSMQILTTSHAVVPEWVGNRAVKFKFSYINLPDSNANEPKSHGSFTYKVNLKPNLVAGTQIKNTAAIYFDNNAPVLTNTTVNTIEAGVGIKNVDTPLTLNVYPNPASDVLQISGKQAEEVRILNTQGQLVKLFNRPGNNTVSVSGLAGGIYIAEIKVDGVSYKLRIVKI